ncbi:MAG: hypothetical protein A2Z31_05045 [candidate division NC10 bacterium RBG_16_65_8]|nr:MAG: hypothetical protein A2Z31_05045 [candidate division NC10 bacterium RBG_16_65_8]
MRGWAARCLRCAPLLLYAAVFFNARFFLERTTGVLSFLLAAVAAATVILALKEAGELLAAACGRPLRLAPLTLAALVAGAAVMGFAFIEAALQGMVALQSAGDREGLGATLAMPQAWERRPVQMEGAAHAYYWHAALHAHNHDQMRRIGAFPRKQSDSLRIIALGDSLTYGYGVAAEEAYPAVLERELGKRFAVEVLNLGVAGAQSADV